MGEGAGLADWLLVAGQGMLVALFFAFFYLVIRLCLYLGESGCAYNNLAKAPDGEKKSAAESTGDPGKPLIDQGNKT